MRSFSFEDLIPLYRTIDFNADRTEGRLHVTNASMLSALLNVVSEDNQEYSRIFLKDVDEDDITIGDTVNLLVQLPLLKLGCLATDVDALLRFPKARIAELDAWFLITPRFAKNDTPVPDSIVRYRHALRLIGLLAETAAFLDKEKQELVFLDRGKFVIPVFYTEESLAHFPMEDVGTLIDAICQDLHKEQKLKILAETIIAMTRDLETKERFRFLLAHLGELRQKFSDGYSLFASGFSYDKIKDELETAKIDFSIKIHKVFTDIQNQILAIPLATVIVATQMKIVETSTSLVTNTALLAGCWVFYFLVHTAIRNQMVTLEALREEITRQSEKIAQEYASSSISLDKIFSFLTVRGKQQNRNLECIKRILLACIIAASIGYALCLWPFIASALSQSEKATPVCWMLWWQI